MINALFNKVSPLVHSPLLYIYMYVPKSLLLHCIMASLSLTTTASKSFHLSSNKNPTLNSNKPKQFLSHATRRSVVSCTANNNGDDNQTSNNHERPRPDQPRKFDRRNMLVGLGGLYGAAGLGRPDPFAFADPVSAPDLSKCGAADLPQGSQPRNCCPPTSPEIIDYRPPHVRRNKLRVRPAAHAVGRDYIAKYNRALTLMKALPNSDPRSFSQQADVHCAYCNGAYDQTGFPGVELQVHSSWLFFPFHRWYLYFYERILGKLIDDPSFAIPFWNWDSPAGMQMPAMFTDPDSALHNVNRSPKHQPPYAVDLDYAKRKDFDSPPKAFGEQAAENMAIMYRQMVSGARTAELFFGGDCRAGEEPESSPGSIENIPHGPVHVWCGDENQDNGEDMGNFYSAGRDPLFYSHHANVDRMWSVWKTLPGRNRRDFSDPDWLDAEFHFYDENADLVRVSVRDCIDTRKLGYVYEPVPIPWLTTRPRPRPRPRTGLVRKLFGSGGGGAAIAAPSSDFPITLEKAAVTVPVARPARRRGKEEKEEEEEVLVIQGIGFDRNSNVKFDVYVNDEDESGPGKSEFAGSFVSVPHITKSNQKANTNLKLGISELIEDIGAEDDDEVLVTLVPKSGTFSIGGIVIVLSS